MEVGEKEIGNSIGNIGRGVSENENRVLEYLSDPKNKEPLILIGDVFEKLREIPSKSINS